MKNKKFKIKRELIILASTLVAIPVALGLGMLVSPVFAGCLVAGVGYVGMGAQAINYNYEKNKFLRDEVKKIKNEQNEEIKYETLVDENGKLKSNYKQDFEERTGLNNKNENANEIKENEKSL